MPLPKVELIGVPGAGKSTIVAELAALAERDGVRLVERAEHRERLAAYYGARSRVRRATGLGRFVIRERSALARGLALARSMRPALAKRWWRTYVLLRLLQNDALFDALERPEDDVLVLDQDVLQEIWSVLYLRPVSEEGALRELLEALRPRLPRVVAHVALDGPSAKRRIANRSARVGARGDVDRMPEIDPAVLDEMNVEAARIARLAAEIGGGELVSLEGHDRPAVSAAALWDVVARHLGGE